MNKRGLSTIIVTLIIVLLSLVAVGIIWAVVSRLLLNNTKGVSLDKFTINGEIENVAVNTTTNNVSLTVARKSGAGEIEGIKFLFESSSDNEVVTEHFVLNQLESKRFNFHLNMNVSLLKKISIIPLFESDSGDIVGNAISVYNFRSGGSSSGGTSCTPASCSALSYSCGSWSDGCSGTLLCGTCSGSQTCNSTGQCQTASCAPATCSGLGYQCGTWGNGTCSGNLSCGSCLGEQTCNASGRCTGNICTPASNPCGTDVCGSVANGTCGTISCGSCSGGYNCVSGNCVLQTGITCEATGANRCWYVDNLATGNNNGSDWANAWKNFSSINWNSINPGDFIYISGGSTSQSYHETLIVGKSGTSSNQMTIKTGQDSGHNGKAIIEGDDPLNGRVGYMYLQNLSQDSYDLERGINLNSRNYITIDGNVNGQNNLVIQNTKLTGINLNGQSTIIRYVEISHIGHYEIADDYYSTTWEIGMGISFLHCGDGTKGCEINHVWVHHTYADGLHNEHNSGSYTSTTSNPNSLHDSIFEYISDDGCETCGSWDVYNDIFRYIRNWDDAGWGAPYSGGGIRASAHPDAVVLDNWGRAWNNTFLDNVGGGGTIYMAFLADGIGSQAFNNIIYETANDTFLPYPKGIVVVCESPCNSVSNILIANNLIVDIGFYAIRIYPKSTTNQYRNITVKNNIIVNAYNNAGTNSPIEFYDGDYTQNDIDYENNIIYSATGRNKTSWKGTEYTNSQMCSNFGLQCNGNSLDPKFVSYSYRNINNNFHLQASSPAINNGAFLGKFVDLRNIFNTDKDGISRPQGSAWDIGAYEYH